MSALLKFLEDFPRFPPNVQYGPVDASTDTDISFYNYFGQLFPEDRPDADLHVTFLDRRGREVHGETLRVPAGAFVQYSPRGGGITSDGMVAVAAVPCGDLDAMNRRGLKLRRQVSTGYYVRWGGRAGVDVMHEWGSLSRGPIPRAVHHAGFVESAEVEEHGLVIMNPVAAAGAAADPVLVLLDVEGRPVFEARLAPIPPLGTARVSLSEVFPGFLGTLRAAGRAVVRLIGGNVLPPLTLERHCNGDIHVHHS